MRLAMAVVAAGLAMSTAARATDVPAVPAPTPVAPTAPTAEFTAIEIEKRSAGTFYIAGAIDGFGALDMLVDTGSSYLVITQPMAEALEAKGRASFSRGLEGRMADGSTRVVPLYRLDAVRLGESCWVHDVEAAVFPAGSRTILGMNVLSRLTPFTFSAEPARLGLAHCQGPPTLKSAAAAAPIAGSAAAAQ
jgi:clan AA aspartic protease (TIGR02281 family)